MVVQKKKNPNRYFYTLLVIVALVVTLGSVITGAFIQQSYDIQLDGVVLEKIKAPKDMENRYATEQNMRLAQEAADKMDPITERNPAVNEQLKSDLDGFFNDVDELRRYSTMMSALVTEPAEGEAVPTPTPVPKLTNLSENNTRLLIDMDSIRYSKFVNSIYGVAESMLEAGVIELDSKSLQAVKAEMDKLDLNADTRNLGYDIIVSFLKPNVFINEEATRKAKEERAASYEKVYYLKDETIVNEGDRISEAAYAALEDLGYIQSNYFESIVPIAGAVIVLIIIFTLGLLYIYFFNNSIIQSKNEITLLFALYIAVILLVRLLIGIPFQFLPIYAFTLLVAMLLDSKLASVLNVGLTLICFMIYKGGIDFMLYHMLAGFAISMISQYTTDRNKIIIAAFLASIANLIIYAGVFLLIEKNYNQELLYNSIYSAAAGMFAVVLCFGSMPIWEACFAVVTTVKLLDLTNPNSELLRRLAIEAPGTYHHCIIVANLAETAAYDINANPNLARAGGYYHDIGKLKYPQYFSENILGENPHEDMDPYSSAQVIKSHITYGMELADSHKLPKVVRDIIIQHHGKTLMKFFYYKSLKTSPSDTVQESDFRYNFMLPQSREAAVVMLADTVEAAVRSMIPSGKTMDEVNTFVKELVKDKLDDGQLIDSTLTIKDLDTIVNSFMRVFKGMYHERIPYPKVDKTDKAKA